MRVRAVRQWVVLAICCAATLPARADENYSLPLVDGVAAQPVAAQAERIASVLESLGSPLSPEQRQQLDAALENGSDSDSVKQIQQVLDPLCLAGVAINPEGRVKSEIGPAAKQLVQQGWTVFLVKVHNEAGVTAPLRCTSPNAAAMHKKSSGSAEPANEVSSRDVTQRWLDVQMFDEPPLNSRLSGLGLEYRVIELFSRDAGPREAELRFDAGQGTQDLGGRNAVSILFDCRRAIPVRLEVIDDSGEPTTGQFIFRDVQRRVLPARSRRLAPDFFFHDQIYRHHGETVLMPPGEYEVTYTRGPEYHVRKRKMTVPAEGDSSERFELERWVHLAKHGWISGDHHVHAAGCSHYESPTQGVEPADMMRHLLGEDVNVGCVLTWGPCWYHQKQFFDGKTHPLSTPQHLMRYDVEVSGFPSSHAGHLVLLRLQEDDYPDTARIEDWPSWCLPILQWGKSQGGVVGFAHSGWGLQVDDDKLPSYEIPAFDGIGANEFIVDVTHDACDIISSVDTPIVWELSIWYHTLNCGFKTRISGETDFPCIYDDRVGLGRVYVKNEPQAPVDFDKWVDGLRDGRSYCCDGLTHLYDFKVNDLGVGEPGADGQASTLAVKQGEPLTISVNAAALLQEQPKNEIRSKPLSDKPYWHVERARIGDSREVAVELIVNGIVVDQKKVPADGTTAPVTFEYTPERSCWVALRVFPAAHTNPVFVEVDGEPIRASKRSAQWCLDSVDRCWASKSPQIRPTELAAAEKAYEHARVVYREILEAAHDDAK
ncbi:MAG: CehA/McbA family metallohydrolase [Pirellulales bacterium]